MNDFNDLIRHGAANMWLFIPTAILLGALHGLEPGHSKTMMAAFIVAIRGTILQAVLLGLAAAFSHTLVIWVLAILALHYGSHWNAETTEPYFQMASAAMIIGIAGWMAWRTRRDLRAEEHHGKSEFAPHGGIPTRTGHTHGDHSHQHHVSLTEEPHSHDHPHGHHASHGSEEYRDAHELFHAADIQKRFADRKATTWQIIGFGLTGGLLPCPAAFTILLICLQLKKFTLGIAMVLAFSAGLALTLVTVGVLAAWGMRHAEKRVRGLNRIARRLPYFSSALLILMGLFVGIQGWLHLHAAH